jgi:predicted RND superfamily exporter protein
LNLTSFRPPDPNPVIGDVSQFDRKSGSYLERLIFNNRWIVLVACLFATLVLAIACLHLNLNASFDKMLPKHQQYIVNYLTHERDLKGFGNAIRIAVETRNGTIFTKDYLDTLRRLNDEVFLLPGVDRSAMKSLWTPATRWSAVTEEGLDGGPVIPADYDGSSRGIATVKANVDRSGEIGQLVAADLRSSVLFVPLLENNNETGKPLDYAELSNQLEAIRSKYQTPDLVIHTVGFAKLIGDLIDGLHEMLLFFVVAVLITGVILFSYTRCLRSTLLVVGCSIVAVVWQLGLVALSGTPLDPYSILVPFLIFAIGMSHGVQKMNGIMQDIGRGTHPWIAARYTFRRLFMTGLTALLCDTVGFAVLVTIKIEAIQTLALIASVGVAALVITNLILLPVLLSFIGVSSAAAERSLTKEQRGDEGALLRFFGRFTDKRWAVGAIVGGAVLALSATWVSRSLQIGDIDPGAPELRSGSRYNRDNAFMTANYAASSDVFVVMIKTPQYGCTAYDTLVRVDTLASEIRQLPGVESTNSLAELSKFAVAGMNEGSPKWYELVRTQSMLNAVIYRAPRELFNESCNFLSLIVYLRDHRASTLTRVVDHVAAFAKQNDTSDVKFLMAAGTAGFDAATNIVVARSMTQMLILVYAAVTGLCLLVFRSWRATVAAILPLALTSVVCEALMVLLGIGVKVATLPVVALGVGIGVDYALYTIAVIIAYLRVDADLPTAARHARLFTGRVVMLTGFMLAIAVATWAWSPIKFQADMGILLAFMFVLNMVGALVLLPAIGLFIMPKKESAATAAVQSPTRWQEGMEVRR